MNRLVVKIIAALVLLALLAVMIPSATPIALGEEAAYPVYAPVTLEAETVSPIPYDAETPYAPHAAGFLPDDTGYADPSLSVRVEMTRAYDTNIMLVWVQIADPSQVRTQLAGKYPSKAAHPAHKIAKRVNAVLAINGDYFTYHNDGFAVRNGVVLRERYSEKYDTLIFDDKGDLTIVTATTQEKIEAFEGNIVHAFTFGPGLVMDGVMRTDWDLDKSFAPEKETQRIVLAQMGPLSYLIVATEGPENKGSTGLTMPEIAQFMADMGAWQAYNLDGGSSSSVALNGKKINSLSSGKVRSIGDIIYFVTAVPQEDAADE